MEAIRLAAFGAAGLIFGSFLTVVTYRMPRRQSVVAPRSACPGCGAMIRARDNVPIVSYLLLEGRCRHCRTRISVEYPLTEAACAGLFVAVALAFDRIAVAGLIVAFLAVMMASALIDVRHRIIPNALVLPSLAIFAAAVGILSLAGHEVSFLRAILGMVAVGGGLLLVSLISPGGMGMGDVKLGALIGLVLGAIGWRYVAVAAGAGVLLGGIWAVVALLAGKGRKSAIPFGPSLAAGAAVSALLAPRLASWYAGFLR